MCKKVLAIVLMLIGASAVAGGICWLCSNIQYEDI